MQANCPRCGAALTADTTECPVWPHGDVDEIVLPEVQRPAPPARRRARRRRCLVSSPASESW